MSIGVRRRISLFEHRAGMRLRRRSWLFSSCGESWVCALVVILLCFFGGSFGAWRVEASEPASRPTQHSKPASRPTQKVEGAERPTQKVEGAGGVVVVEKAAAPALRIPPKSPQEKRFRHEFEGRLHITSDHTGLDSGVAPEFQYRFRMDQMLELRAGIRYAPPGAGDALRYYLGGFLHIPLPLVRDGALGIVMLHNSYGDIQKGENSFLFLHRVDTRYFAFDGGLLLRMELTRPENFRNPLYFGTEYLEVFYVYDMRVKIDFTFPKLGGSVLEVGAGIMNFLDNEVLGPATGGYRLYASWNQPGIGRFEAMGGMYSYGFWAFAGYYGRWFLRFSYTYTLDI